VREHSAAAPAFERELEARFSPDCRQRAEIARLKGSRSVLKESVLREGEPFRRASRGLREGEPFRRVARDYDS